MRKSHGGKGEGVDPCHVRRGFAAYPSPTVREHSRALPQRESGRTLPVLLQDMRAPFRDAISVRSLRGWRAEKRKPNGSALPFGSTAGASRRANRSVWFGAGPRFPVFQRSLERAAVVSQLLAGSPSGPGRSSGAARVPMLARMNPQAPHLIPLSQRLAMAPLNGGGGCSLRADWSAGITQQEFAIPAQLWIQISESERRARGSRSCRNDAYDGNERLVLCGC